MTHQTRTPWLGLLAVAAFALAVRWPIAEIPLERDEGEYAYIAQHWLQGEVPYRDSFDQKPPGVFVLYAAILAFIGSTPAAIHWGAQIYTLGTLALLYLTGARLFGQRAGLAAAGLAAYMTADCCVLGNAANTEIVMILPMTASFLLTWLAIERGSGAMAFAAGVCATFAVMGKQVAATNVMFGGLVLLILGRPRWRLSAGYVAGGLTALAPILAYFHWNGALYEFWDCVVGHNLSYSTAIPLSLYPEYFMDSFGFICRQWWPAFALVALGNWPSSAEERRNVCLVLLWLVASFVGVSISGNFRNHYFIQTIPAVALLAGRGVDRLTRRWPGPRGGLAAAALIAFAVCWSAGSAPWYCLWGTPAQKSWATYGASPFPESLAVANDLKDRAAPGDTVFVFGSEPQIPFYAGLKHASRYIFTYPLTTAFPGTRERQASVLRELEEHRPRFIVTIEDERSFLSDPASPTLLRDELQKLLKSSYTRTAHILPETTEVVPADRPVPASDPNPIIHVWERSAGR